MTGIDSTLRRAVLPAYRATCAPETGGSPGKSAGRRLELLLWALGGLGLFCCLGAASRMLLAARSAASFASHPAADPGANRLGAAPAQSGHGDPAGTSHQSPATSSSPAAGTPRNQPAVIGRVEIPAIGLVTPLLAGDDSMSLTEGAGHIPGTAVPGGLGTVGIAGHRDTHFRSLSRAAPGMEVRLIDRTGTYHYRVTSTEIVAPEQVSVLDIQSVPGLVLITCYPFRYIGAAPDRFVVHAALLSVAPD